VDDRRDDDPGLARGGGGSKKGEPDGSDEALGRSRGGLTTKLHLVCDGNGLPLAIHLTAGQRSESAQFETVCALVEAPRRPRWLLADRGYDAKRIRAWLRERRIRAVIPERKLAPGKKRRRRGRPPVLDKALYARRNAVERLVGWLKEHRSLATRFDKRADSFLAMVKLGCIRRLLRAAFPHRA
jgi:transposase